MDKGDEDLDGPRSARIWAFSECDYTRIVLFFGAGKKVSPITLLALLIWRCWVYTGKAMLTIFSARTAGTNRYVCTTQFSHC